MNRKEELEKLIKRNEELKPIVFKSFKTSEGLDEHYNNHKQNYDEYDSNLKQIQQLKYELKTPEEKKEYDEYLRKLKLKAQGKPFI